MDSFKTQNSHLSSSSKPFVKILQNLIVNNLLKDFKSIMENEKINPNITSDNGTPLIFFLANDKTKIRFLEYLISIGANVNITDKKERTVLFIACSSENTEAVKLLLQKKELEIDKENRTFAFVMNAFTVAVLGDHYKIAKMIMYHGANPTKSEEILLSETQLYQNAYTEKYKRLIDFYKRWKSGKKQILLAYYLSQKSSGNPLIKLFDVRLLPKAIIIRIADEFL